MTEPSVEVVAEPHPTLQQRLAWAWLWRRLLAPENGNAPAVEAEASACRPAERPERRNQNAEHPKCITA